MTTTATPAPTATAIAPQRRSVLMDVASRFGMEPQAFEATLRATVVPSGATREQFAAFLVVAREHDLNPLTKEIYAFPAKGGGIVPIVGVDGWVKMMNRHPQFDGIDFETVLDGGKIVSTTAIVYRKDRTRPVRVTEYMAECQRQTDPWKQSPSRMLRHRALIQGVRVAFGFAGVMDEEEFERGGMIDVTPPPAPTRDQFVGQAAAAQTTAAEPVRAPTPAEEEAADRAAAQFAQTGTAPAGEPGDDPAGEPQPEDSAPQQTAAPVLAPLAEKPTAEDIKLWLALLDKALAEADNVKTVNAIDEAAKAPLARCTATQARNARMNISRRRVELQGGAQ
jgi:phage recombination protein Bet